MSKEKPEDFDQEAEQAFWDEIKRKARKSDEPNDDPHDVEVTPDPDLDF